MHSTPPTLLGATPPELHRSVAARAIGRMAQASGLFCANFEHRLELPLPDWWQVADADLGPYPWEPEGGWRLGALHETKFRTFRLDRRIGSFHPAHQAKWSTHELCHGLMGFGWAADVGPLWLATAARLAELVPVALWYFFDEAGLHRCPRHDGQGALFGAACSECESTAAGVPGVDSGPGLARWRQQGRAFVEGEIDAAWRTLRSGVPISNRYGTLDLCTDGLAYTRAHLPVLTDPLFAEWVERFCSPERGHHDNLDSLVGRARDVVAALCDEGDAPALEGHAGTWAAQDLGWRLSQLRAEVDGEVDRELEALVEDLAAAAGSGPEACMDVIDTVLGSYEALFDDYVLPEPEDLFAVGYPLPRGYGVSRTQLAEGLRASLPLTCGLLGNDLEEAVHAFSQQDPWCRSGLGDRFADWARAHLSGAVADQAALEAALLYVPAPDPAEATLGVCAAPGARWRWAKNSRLVTIGHDVGTDPQHPGTGAPLPEPICVCVVRGIDGAREVLAVNADAQARTRTATAALSDRDRPLVAAGLLVPDCWNSPDWEGV